MQAAFTTRHCVDVRGRQVHYRHSGEGPAVVLLHASPRSSSALLPLMAAAPAGVSLYAFDTPGFGLSDALAPDRPNIEAFADALVETLAALGIERAAIYATHTGAAIAIALAVRSPRHVSRLVIDGIAAFDAAERAQILHSYLPPFEPHVDGTHMAWLWSRVRDQYLFFPWNHRGTGARRWLPLPDAATLHAVALDLLCAADYRGAYSAAFRTDATEWVARLRVPTLIGARPGDMLLPHLRRLATPPPGVRLVQLPADTAACAAVLWQEIVAGLPGEASTPPIDAALPTARIGDTFSGGVGQRLHLRGSSSGTGRPLVLLHDSPGGPRSLDAALASAKHSGPVVAPSLPGHGESDPAADLPADALIELLHQGLLHAGLGDATLQGFGLGGCLAQALTKRRPKAWHCSAAAPAWQKAPPVPGALTPRVDGAQLFAAWQHARDTAILGPWWCRSERNDFGDALDTAAIQRDAVEALKESPAAAAWRLSMGGRM